MKHTELSHILMATDIMFNKYSIITKITWYFNFRSLWGFGKYWQCSSLHAHFMNIKTFLNVDHRGCYILNFVRHCQIVSHSLTQFIDWLLDYTHGCQFFHTLSTGVLLIQSWIAWNHVLVFYTTVALNYRPIQWILSMPFSGCK